MANYTIIETHQGLKVIEVPPGESLATAAARHGGVTLDSNLYRRLQDAYEALTHLAQEEQDDEGE